MSSVQPQPESVSRAGRLDQILRELLHQTPGVEAAAVVSFDGLPMASALPAGMDEDRVAAMSAALLSLAERAAQGLGRGDLSQVYIEGEHGTVFLVSAQDEGVLIAVTAAGAKVGMMLYEVKLAANRVGEVLHGPAPLPAPLPANVTRGYLDAQDAPSYGRQPSYEALTSSRTRQATTSRLSDPAYVEPAYAEACLRRACVRRARVQRARVQRSCAESSLPTNAVGRARLTSPSPRSRLCPRPTTPAGRRTPRPAAFSLARQGSWT